MVQNVLILIRYIIFEPILVDNKVQSKIRYREVFTGFIADSDSKCFDLPYVVEPEKFTGVLTDYQNSKIPKYRLLLVLNEVNNLINERNKEQEQKQRKLKV